MVSEPSLEYQLIDLAGIDPSKIAAFQVHTARKDPLFRPLPLARFDTGLAAVDANHELMGIAWSQESDAGMFLDVRVSVEHRRTGLGSALLSAEITDQKRVFALCEAGQRGAIAFLAGHGFEHETSVFAYRWDGEPVDVPPSFKTASIQLVEHGFERWSQDRERVFEALPRTIQMLTPSEHDEFLCFEASVNGLVVGAVTAVKGHQDFGLMSFWIEAEHRGSGIGRLLLCNLLKEATLRDCGVVVHLDADQEVIGSRMKVLGLWAYRTWHCFRRDQTE